MVRSTLRHIDFEVVDTAWRLDYGLIDICYLRDQTRSERERLTPIVGALNEQRAVFARAATTSSTLSRQIAGSFVVLHSNRGLRSS